MNRRNLIKGSAGVAGLFAFFGGKKAQAKTPHRGTDRITETTIVRHVYGRDEGVDIRKEYYDSWVDERGTQFKVQPLAKSRDSEEYLFSAYPYIEQYIEAGSFDTYDYKAFMMTTEFSGQEVKTLGWNRVMNFVQQTMDGFVAQFYEKERLGELELGRMENVVR